MATVSPAFSAAVHAPGRPSNRFSTRPSCTSARPTRRARRRALPRARTSEHATSFRRAAVLATATSPRPAPPAPPRKTRPAPPSPPSAPRAPPRYAIRLAAEPELYTVADIRCEAFYGAPSDAHYYPVRRREIYMAMRDRVESGNRCLVVVDSDPPEEWTTFANERGELVVGSVDVSLHGAATGKRRRFEPATDGEGRKVYVSSMAVRREWQRRGLAQRLLACVDDMARQFGVKDVFLHVEWENEPAVHVYNKSGFSCVGTEGGVEVPRWLHHLAKKEHTLMRKTLEL